MWTKVENVNAALINHQRRNEKKFHTTISKYAKRNEPEQNEIFEQHEYHENFAFVNYNFHNKKKITKEKKNLSHLKIF